MIYLERCPACKGSGLRSVYRYNDLRHLSIKIAFPPEWKRSDYTLCQRCGLIFARRRQSLSEAEEYYTRFAELENRYYATYPPPENYLGNKVVAAVEISDLLESRGLLNPHLRVLHIRCDAGTLLARLRDKHGISNVYGLDYFESNLRYAREHFSLKNVGRLSASRIGALPFDEGRFDLILSNHQLTHALEPMSTLAELRDLLAPGGVMLMYNEQDHLLLFKGKGSVERGLNNFHKQLLTESSFKNVCLLSGLEAEIVTRRKNTMVALVRSRHPAPVEELSMVIDPLLQKRIKKWIRRHREAHPRFGFLARLRNFLLGRNAA